MPTGLPNLGDPYPFPILRETCRVCGYAPLTPLFSLGEQLISDFVEKDKVHAGIRCPIELELCLRCTLVQAKYTAPQELLYSRHYWYRSGVTQTMRDALRDVTRAAEDYVSLQAGDIVLDIGSNDGTLLRSYATKGIVRTGVEPAINLQEEGAKGIDFLVEDFWSASAYYSAARKWNWGGSQELFQAKVITACGMFYDLEDPNQFIADVAKVLRPDGIFIAQLMCLRNMLNVGDIGNLAHEHLEFYSLMSLDYLFGQHGLELFDIDRNEVNGESYRLFVRLKRNTLPPRKEGAGYRLRMCREAEEKLDKPDSYVQLRSEMETNRRQVHGFIADEVAKGKKVWVYGASTKGNVLLQWYGLDHTLIVGAADRSPEKWGKYTIGTGIQIHSEDYARAAKPDYFLVLPYAFLPEFLERERDWRDNGGKFIVPLPQFRVV